MALREEIFARHLEDGQELAQEEIARTLGVSRIPVREAFLMLESEGLLERLPNRHVRVVGLTAERLRQNFAVLAALEGALAALALPVLQGKTLPPPQEDRAFHHQFGQVLGNHMLCQLYTTQRQILFEGVTPPRDDARTPLNSLIAQTIRSGTDPRPVIRHYYEILAEKAIKELGL